MGYWLRLGYSDNPFDTQPLDIGSAKDNVFFGREKNVAKFLSMMNGKTKNLICIGGLSGVGKTTFFNYIQGILNDVSSSPRLLPDRELPYIGPNDTEHDAARKIANGIVKNIIHHNNINVRSELPDWLKQLNSWLDGEPVKSSSYQLKVAGTGGGKSTIISKVDIRTVTTEQWKEIINSLIRFVVRDWKFDGVLIAVDNLEEVDLKKLQEIFMIFRDTIFSIDRLSLVFIGSPTIYDELSIEKPKIAERIQSPAVVIHPFTEIEGVKLVKKRVEHYGGPGSILPISELMIRLIFSSAEGLPRAAFKVFSEIIEYLDFELEVAHRDKLAKEAYSMSEQDIQTGLKSNFSNLLEDGGLPDRIVSNVLLAVSIQRTLQMLSALPETPFKRADIDEVIDGRLLSYNTGAASIQFYDEIQPIISNSQSTIDSKRELRKWTQLMHKSAKFRRRYAKEIEDIEL